MDKWIKGEAVIYKGKTHLLGMEIQSEVRTSAENGMNG